MLGFYFIGALAAAGIFYVCRRLLLARLRVERPDLYPSLQPALANESVLDAFGPTALSSDFLKNQLDRLGLRIEETSKVWIYVKIMRLCIAVFYLLSLMAAFSLLFRH